MSEGPPCDCRGSSRRPPAERSSWRKDAIPETAWHMSKAGNSHLRAAAYRRAMVGVQHNPIIAAR